LGYDIEHAKQWAMGTEKHKRPSHIQRQLKKEQSERQTTG